MQLQNAPADPWAANRPGPMQPRLTAYVHARPTRYGGVVNLSAALWGGHFERTVALSIHEARTIGRELTGLADALEKRQFAERTRRIERRRAGTPASLLAATGPPHSVAGTAAHTARITTTAEVRPTARSGSRG